MPDELYYVAWSPQAKSVVRELAKKALELGRLEELKQTLAELNERLKREPLEVGELFRAKGVVVEHAAAHKLVGVNFGVDTKRKIVAVRRCWARNW